MGKTEAMLCRIKKAEVAEEVENTMKERMSVKVDGCEMWGWIAPAKWRAELSISDWSEEAKGEMVIQFAGWLFVREGERRISRGRGW